MNDTERRGRLRALMARNECASPACIYDPLSARIAEGVGYQVGVLPGSVISSTLLAAPDYVLHTLTEAAVQVRRITRVSDLSVFVDADHGYGNALNVMRTIEELEHAGVAALSIEDTSLPIAFGQAAGQERLISLEEATGKIAAAVAARRDPSLVIVARTSSLVLEDTQRAIARVQAYAKAGADAIYPAISVAGKDISGSPDFGALMRRLHEVAKLPIFLSVGKAKISREELAACGVRLAAQGLQPVGAMVKALYDTYAHLHRGGAPGELASKVASAAQMEELTGSARYKQWRQDFMN
jgi:carboxyvinyl-carboxyphosphonate phosphorylmutase